MRVEGTLWTLQSRDQQEQKNQGARSETWSHEYTLLMTSYNLGL